MRVLKRAAAAALALVLTLSIFCGCTAHNNGDGTECLLRLHIRANSNSVEDQSVKLTVRDAVVELLSGRVSGAGDLGEAMAAVDSALPEIVKTAEKVLREEGFTYGARARLTEEFFPTRSYENVVVESGVYDALIIELGEGKGDNWWCVIYPPLCFVRANQSDRIAYRSKLKELWERYFGKG